jgi:hypothetical protein
MLHKKNFTFKQGLSQTHSLADHVQRNAHCWKVERQTDSLEARVSRAATADGWDHVALRREQLDKPWRGTDPAGSRGWTTSSPTWYYATKNPRGPPAMCARTWNFRNVMDCCIKGHKCVRWPCLVSASLCTVHKEQQHWVRVRLEKLCVRVNGYRDAAQWRSKKEKRIVVKND